jgi:hypothetical protein
MGAGPETIARLQAILNDSSPALRAYLRPEQRDGALYFTLDEVILVARRPA